MFCTKRCVWCSNVMDNCKGYKHLPSLCSYVSAPAKPACSTTPALPTRMERGLQTSSSPRNRRPFLGSPPSLFHQPIRVAHVAVAAVALTYPTSRYGSSHRLHHLPMMPPVPSNFATRKSLEFCSYACYCSRRGRRGRCRRLRKKRSRHFQDHRFFLCLKRICGCGFSSSSPSGHGTRSVTAGCYPHDQSEMEPNMSVCHPSCRAGPDSLAR